MQEEEEILDLPVKEEEKRKEYRLLRISSLLLFILALFFRLMKWQGHAWLLVLGAATFLVWSVFRFIALKEKTLSEILYLPGRFLLIGGLTIRYTLYWPYDKYLVYSGMLLFLLGLLASFRGR